MRTVGEGVHSAHPIAPDDVAGEVEQDDHAEHAERLEQAIDDDGGPLIYNGSEAEQRSLDSTCRKLHRFLNQPQR